VSGAGKKFDLERVGFVINSQKLKHHRNIAIDTKYDLIEDLLPKGVSRPKVGQRHHCWKVLS
jgi:hypothetical protein